MPRLIARFLLLVALTGNLASLALAAAPPPPHACCIRKAVHHCHGFAGSEQISENGQLAIRSTSCCNHDCCRAVTTAQWAHAQPRAASSFARNVEAYLGRSSSVPPDTRVFGFQSTRAPPHFSIS